MPIRKEEKHRYPKDWPERSALARFKAGNKCQECGVPNGALGGRDETGRWHDAHPTGTNGIRLTWPRTGERAWCAGDRRLKIIRIVLTVGHKDHMPENSEPKNLRVWCQQCHLRHDAKHKAAGRTLRERARRVVRDLFDEKPTHMLASRKMFAALVDQVSGSKYMKVKKKRPRRKRRQK